MQGRRAVRTELAWEGVGLMYCNSRVSKKNCKSEIAEQRGGACGVKRELIDRENKNSRKDLSIHLGWSTNGTEEGILDCNFKF